MIQPQITFLLAGFVAGIITAVIGRLWPGLLTVGVGLLARFAPFFGSGNLIPVGQACCVIVRLIDSSRRIHADHSGVASSREEA
jgi:hypothetical protein